MATLILPADSVSEHYDFGVELEGRGYTLEVRWNGRAGLWFLSIVDAEGAIIVASRAIVVGSNLAGQSVDARLPPGAFLAVDTSDENRDPGRNDLGSRVLLVYVESTP